VSPWQCRVRPELLQRVRECVYACRNPLRKRGGIGVFAGRRCVLVAWQPNRMPLWLLLRYKTGARQLATENERSLDEFLRNRRQTTYFAFNDQQNTTFDSLVVVMGLLGPHGPEQSPSVYDVDRTRFVNEYRN
jgi:hypothetical protein